MSRIFIVFGLVAAVVILLQVKEGKLGTNDVFSVVGANQDIAALVKPVERDVVKPAVTEQPVAKVPEEEQKALDKEEKKVEPVRILAFGDMMLGRYVRVLMDKNGLDYPFKNLPRGTEFFPGADVVFGNLEGPIKGKGKKGGTSMVFNFGEDISPLLKDTGFNLLSIANNHAVDQGWTGRDTTIKSLEEAGLNWCGHPSEAAEESVYYGTYQEKKIAFVCFHDVTFKLEMDKANELIKQVRPNVDLLVVSIHWGIEYKNTADKKLQVEKGHQFIDAGADFIIGHHPHVVQNFEIYNGRFIFYSLGNFVFDQYWSQNTQKELAINITLDKKEDGKLKTMVHLIPMKSDYSQSRLMSEGEKKKWIEEFIGYGNYDDTIKEQIRKGVIESEA